MRKSIQIAALRAETPSAAGGGGHDGAGTALVALCDDGTIWTMFGAQGNWAQVKKIPQGPMLEDWLLEVGARLASHHFFRRNVIDGVVAEHRGILIQKHNDGVAASEAARLVAELLQ